MLLDKQLEFSSAQALTATAVSTNVIDLASARQIGIGEALSIVLFALVAADFTTGDETYSVALQTDDNSSFSSPTTLFTQTITAAQLTAGAIVAIAMPRAGVERYIRLNYTLAGTTPTVTLSAYLQPTDMIQGPMTKYPSAITIS